MTIQEILEGIARHRANPVAYSGNGPISVSLDRKINEIEWALQAFGEYLRDRDASH